EGVGIARVAGEQGIHGLHRIEGELRHVALRQHDGARLAELLDLERVGLRHHAFQRQRACRGRHVGGLIVVLHDQRHAVERAGPDCAYRASSASASFSASGLTTTIAFSAGPLLSYVSMRSRYIWTSARHVSVFALNAAWMSAIVGSTLRSRSKARVPTGHRG